MFDIGTAKAVPFNYYGSIVILNLPMKIDPAAGSPREFRFFAQPKDTVRRYSAGFN